jgi:CubicO group peptidase (beta-lactamase class C family)
MNYKYRAIFLILMVGVLAGCLQDEDIKQQKQTHIPEQLNDGWEIYSPSSEGFDSSKIDEIYEKFFSEDLYPTAQGLLIVRNGKLVAEAYCRDNRDRENYHHLQSATKSVTSILMGIAWDKGMIDSVNIPIFDFFPEHFDSDIQKQLITLHHALTMETGLDFDNDINTEELFNYNGDSLEYVLNRDLVFTPGTNFSYNDGSPQLISGVIQKISGKTEEEFARENLFLLLGINYYQWETHADGKTFGAFGLWLKPRDMAKIGKLMVQKGSWDGQQIVSEEWVMESTGLQTPYTNYGYYWWIDPENKAFSARGHGGQRIFVVQEKNLAIVITADPYSSDAALSPGLETLITDILNAILIQ